MADEYRRNAIECLQLADGISDAPSRLLLIHMAQAWLRLAEPSGKEPHHGCGLRDAGPAPGSRSKSAVSLRHAAKTDSMSFAAMLLVEVSHHQFPFGRPFVWTGLLFAKTVASPDCGGPPARLETTP